jgi:formamidase
MHAQLKTSVIKNGIEKFAMKQPIFLPSPVDPLYSAQLVFEGRRASDYHHRFETAAELSTTGLSVDVHGDGKQYNMDVSPKSDCCGV